jgi:hypothetical protein
LPRGVANANEQHPRYNRGRFEGPCVRVFLLALVIQFFWGLVTIFFCILLWALQTPTTSILNIFLNELLNLAREDTGSNGFGLTKSFLLIVNNSAQGKEYLLLGCQRALQTPTSSILDTIEDDLRGLVSGFFCWLWCYNFFGD